LHRVQNKIVILLFFSVILITGCAGFQTGSGAGVNRTVLNKIDNAVFEVVIKKPFDSPETRELKLSQNRENEIFIDDIVYEKDFPWEAVDYQARVDEYLSVGTAFAISKNQLLTAAHVLTLDKDTLWGDYYIRDKQGRVFELDKIQKYANNRDFTVFTANGLDNMKPLKLDPDFELNTQVYAVGNALGEGIIVRDGLLTSTSKEFENGEWDYLRYSAAASPGNSGGPLIDSRGRVLGVVLKKSENENLNYALPISEVLEAKEEAVYHRFMSYHLAMTYRKFGPVKYTDKIDLPLHYKELRSRLSHLEGNQSSLMIEELKKEHRDFLFPNGEGSYRLFHRAGNYGFPQIAAEGEEDGIWGLYQPQDIESAELSNNGFVSFGGLGGFLMMRFRKPLDVPLKTLIDDTEYLNEMLLDAYGLNRYFGQQAVRIVSLGQADEAYNHTDRWNREWLVRSWDIRFADSKLMIYAMPVPGGFITLGLLDQVGSIDQTLRKDIEEYLNYIFFSYSGTFEEWSEYLKLDVAQSEFFRSTTFSYTPEEEMFFENDVFRVSYGADFLPVNDDSILTLKATYQIRDGEPRWLPIGASVSDNLVGDNYMALVREYKPEDVLIAGYHENWDNLIHQNYPYNGDASPKGDTTTANSLVDRFFTMEADALDMGGYLYFAGCGFEGVLSDEEMSGKMEMLREAVTIKER
jgi:hypothetical protein